VSEIVAPGRSSVIRIDQIKKIKLAQQPQEEQSDIQKEMELEHQKSLHLSPDEAQEMINETS